MPVAEQELLERENERELLRESLEAAGTGSGAVALVEGPPGIGKSGLLREAAGLADEAGFEVLSGRGSEFERDYAFGVVRQLFEPPLRDATPKRRERLLAGAAGLAAPLFEALSGDEPARGETSHAVLHGLYWLTVNLAGERPLALVVDDAHWLDAPSLRFLAYLANRADDLAVLLVVAVRPFEPGAEVDLLDEIARSRSTRLIRPETLSAQAVDSLVRHEFGRDVDGSFAVACFEATRGNPLFVRELLVTLIGEAVAPTATQAPKVLQAAPSSVARSVARRLRGLDPEAEELASAAAVLGNGAELATAAKIAELDWAAAATAAEALRRAGILSRESLEFVHPVVRAAVYSELSPPERIKRHRSAAALLAQAGVDEDQVVMHVLPCEPNGDSQVVDLLRRAARRAHARGAPDVAATYLRRALTEPPSAEERVDVLVDLGFAELATMAGTGFARLNEALQLAEDPLTRARVGVQVGRALLSWGLFADAHEAFDAALGGLEGGHAIGERLRALRLAAAVAVPALATPEFYSRIDACYRERAELSDPVLLAAVGVTVAVMTGPSSEAAALCQRALADERLTAEEDAAIVAIAGMGLVATNRLREAKSMWDTALAAARAHGSLLASGLAGICRAGALVRLGEIAAAESEVRFRLDVLERRYGTSGGQEALRLVPWLLPPLTDVLIELGELDEASRVLEKYGMTGEVPNIMPIHFIMETRGRLLLAQNRPEEAVLLLRECGRRLEDWRIRNPGLIPWRSSLALALAAIGQSDEGLALAREEMELAQEFEVPRELGIALRAAGLLSGGTAGIELLREAVAVLETSPAELERARALTDLGAALRRKGHRAESREPLRAGLDLAQRCGATALVKRAHEDLVAAGARPRRLMRSGVDALTPSERRVADLGAEGLTNREIAQALFVTEKTVEGHLAHAYRKLDIQTRTDLGQALGGRAPVLQ
jgi:DNA-binding CsgD family transcriptional regulator